MPVAGRHQPRSFIDIEGLGETGGFASFVRRGEDPGRSRVSIQDVGFQTPDNDTLHYLHV